MAYNAAFRSVVKSFPVNYERIDNNAYVFLYHAIHWLGTDSLPGKKTHLKKNSSAHSRFFRCVYTDADLFVLNMCDVSLALLHSAASPLSQLIENMCL